MTIYTDNIIVHLNFPREYTDHLCQVFSKLDKINMTLDFKECYCGFTLANILGHIVSGLLMSVDGNKVMAIENIPQPNCVKDIQSFFGHVRIL